MLESTGDWSAIFRVLVIARTVKMEVKGQRWAGHRRFQLTFGQTTAIDRAAGQALISFTHGYDFMSLHSKYCTISINSAVTRRAPATWVVWPKLKPCPLSQGGLGPFSGSVRAPGARAGSGAHHTYKAGGRTQNFVHLGTGHTPWYSTQKYT